MLAVGSQAGKVWIWRYRAPKPSLEPAHDAEAAGLQLVRSSRLLTG